MVLFFSILLNLNGQTVIESPVIKQLKHEMNFSIESIVSDGYYRISYECPKMYNCRPVFQKFNFDGSIIFKYSSILDETNIIKKVVEFSGKEYALIYKKADNLDRYHYLQEINRETGKLKSPKIESKITSVPKHSRALNYFCNTMVSENQKYLCMYGSKETYPGSFYFKNPPDDKKYGFNEFNIIVLNGELEVTKNLNISINFDPGLGSIVYCNTDNNGEIQIVYKVINKNWKKMHKKGIPFTKYYFVSNLRSNGGKIEGKEINFPDENIESLNVHLLNGKQILYGLTKNMAGSYVSFFQGELDVNSNNFIPSIKHKFSSSELNKLNSTTVSKKFKLFGNNFLAKNYFSSTEGDKFVVFQDYGEDHNSTANPGGNSTSSTNDNIGGYFIVKIDNANNILFMKSLQNGYTAFNSDFVNNNNNIGFCNGSLYLMKGDEAYGGKSFKISLLDKSGKFNDLDLEYKNMYIDRNFLFNSEDELYLRISGKDNGKLVAIK